MPRDHERANTLARSYSNRKRRGEESLKALMRPGLEASVKKAMLRIFHPSDRKAFFLDLKLHIKAAEAYVLFQIRNEKWNPEKGNFLSWSDTVAYNFTRTQYRVYSSEERPQRESGSDEDDGKIIVRARSLNGKISTEEGAQRELAEVTSAEDLPPLEALWVARLRREVMDALYALKNENYQLALFLTHVLRVPHDEAGPIMDRDDTELLVTRGSAALLREMGYDLATAKAALDYVRGHFILKEEHLEALAEDHPAESAALKMLLVDGLSPAQIARRMHRPPADILLLLKNATRELCAMRIVRGRRLLDAATLTAGLLGTSA